MDKETLEVEIDWLHDIKDKLEYLEILKREIVEIINSDLDKNEQIERIKEAIEDYEEEKPICVI